MDEGNPGQASLNAGLALKPVIKELARTQVCFPDIKLLVDRISIVTLPMTALTKENQTYRLYLTDGEKTIQAVLKRKIHSHVTNLDVREGSYVILRTYHLAKGKKLSGKGDVLYIVIEEFYSIGDDGRDVVDDFRRDLYCELIKTPKQQQSAPMYERYGHTKRRIFDHRKGESTPRKHGGGRENLKSYDFTPASAEYSAAQVEDFSYQGSQSSSFSTPSFSTAYSPSPEKKARKRVNPFDEIDPNLTPRSDDIAELHEDVANVNKVFSHSGRNADSTVRGNNSSSPAKHLDISYERDLERVIADDRPGQNENYHQPTDLMKQSHAIVQNTRVATSNPRNLKTSPSYKRFSNPAPRQRLLSITRPLCIRSLESVTGIHASRNKVFDFFAVIFSIEAQVVKPPMMPLKRDMRIVDPSTDKKVLVSVFVNPVSFKPSVGTIALFRCLTTHEWDRGMLNAYPQQCEGKNWFIIDPVGIQGCDVPALRNWWKMKFAQSNSQEHHPG